MKSASCTKMLTYGGVSRALARAAEQGVLGPLETAGRLVGCEGLVFRIRILTSLEKKRAARKRQQSDPFDPPEAELTLAEVELEKHICVLNKFPVLDRHVLLVTREFVSQEEPLTLDDFQALADLAKENDDRWLAFYNCGSESGRSQPHKHLQLVPYPFESDVSQVEDENIWERMPFVAEWRHVESWVQAEHNYRMYRDVLEWLKINSQLTSSHNVLLSPHRLVVIPRRAEECEGISVNALGFCFSLFAANAEGAAKIEELGPLGLLKSVGLAKK